MPIVNGVEINTNPVGYPRLRVFKARLPIEARSPMMRVVPIASDPGGVPGGARIELTDKDGHVYLDVHGPGLDDLIQALQAVRNACRPRF